MWLQDTPSQTGSMLPVRSLFRSPWLLDHILSTGGRAPRDR